LQAKTGTFSGGDVFVTRPKAKVIVWTKLAFGQEG
jgi:hypothetical protein